MLPSERYALVPPSQISACVFCGARVLSDLLTFVSFDQAADEGEQIPAGLIETVEENAGMRAYRAKDAFGRGGFTVTVEKPMMCGDCVAAAARLIGLEDGVPLRAELDERERQAADLEQTVAARDARIVELEDAVAAARTRAVEAEATLASAERQRRPKPKGRPKLPSGAPGEE